MADLDHLDILRMYQAWRTGQDPRLLSDLGFSPGQLTKAVNACIKEIERAREAKCPP
jgi:hypothetical protein